MKKLSESYFKVPEGRPPPRELRTLSAQEHSTVHGIPNSRQKVRTIQTLDKWTNGKWLNQVWSIHSGHCHAAPQRDGALTPAPAMHLGHVVLSARNQAFGVDFRTALMQFTAPLNTLAR